MGSSKNREFLLRSQLTQQPVEMNSSTEKMLEQSEPEILLVKNQKSSWLKILGYVAIILSLVAIISAMISYAASGQSKAIVEINVQTKPFDDEDIEETHVFIKNDFNEAGAQVDQKVVRDKKNGLLTIHMPAHYDKLESTTVFDVDSDWMMTVLPATKSCLMMKKPPVENNTIETNAFELAKNDKSTPNEPSVVTSENTLMVSIRTIVGNEIKHEDVPRKFKPHCPSHFTIHATKIVLDDERVSFTGINEYDYDSPKTSPNPRYRRNAVQQYSGEWGVCQDYQGNNIQGCKHIEGVACPDGKCSHAHTVYECRPTGRSCYYHLVPCSNVRDKDGNTLSGRQLTNCFLHMTNKAEHCTKCCRNQNCGNMMPRCQPSNEGAGPCEWAPWEERSSCSARCGSGNQDRNRQRRIRAGLTGQYCEGFEKGTRDCSGTLSEERQQYYRENLPDVYAELCGV